MGETGWMDWKREERKRNEKVWRERNGSNSCRHAKEREGILEREEKREDGKGTWIEDVIICRHRVKHRRRCQR